MKSFICVIAAVCAASFVSADPAGGDDSWKHVKFFPENTSGPHKEHEQIKAELGAKELSPEEVAYLVTSGSSDSFETIIGFWRQHDLANLNRASPSMCKKEILPRRLHDCVYLDQSNDNSVLFANVYRYCQATTARVQQYCGVATKFFPENESGQQLTHEQIKAELGAKELSPEKVAYLVTSGSSDSFETIIGFWRQHDLANLNRASPSMCKKEILPRRLHDCVFLDQSNDNSVLFANVYRYCQATTAKVQEYCARAAPQQ